LILLDEILHHIPDSSLLQRPEITVQVESGSQRPFDFACTFFKIADKSIPTAATLDILATPFVSCFQSLISLSMAFTSRLKESQHALMLRESFSKVLLLIDRLAARLITPMNIPWDPKEWLNILLASLEYQVSSFFSFVKYY
jgi:hypothetical protein